jgi:hypothetical protein
VLARKSREISGPSAREVRDHRKACVRAIRDEKIATSAARAQFYTVRQLDVRGRRHSLHTMCTTRTPSVRKVRHLRRDALESRRIVGARHALAMQDSRMQC